MLRMKSRGISATPIRMGQGTTLAMNGQREQAAIAMETHNPSMRDVKSITGKSANEKNNSMYGFDCFA